MPGGPCLRCATPCRVEGCRFRRARLRHAAGRKSGTCAVGAAARRMLMLEHWRLLSTREEPLAPHVLHPADQPAGSADHVSDGRLELQTPPGGASASSRCSSTGGAPALTPSHMPVVKPWRRGSAASELFDAPTPSPSRHDADPHRRSYLVRGSTPLRDPNRSSFGPAAKAATNLQSKSPNAGSSWGRAAT